MDVAPLPMRARAPRWKRRLHHMQQYFHAYRIDHVLGFFRIWEIPGDCVSGGCGAGGPLCPPGSVARWGPATARCSCAVRCGAPFPAPSSLAPSLLAGGPASERCSCAVRCGAPLTPPPFPLLAGGPASESPAATTAAHAAVRCAPFPPPACLPWAPRRSPCCPAVDSTALERQLCSGGGGASPHMRVRACAQACWATSAPASPSAGRSWRSAGWAAPTRWRASPSPTSAATCSSRCLAASGRRCGSRWLAAGGRRCGMTGLVTVFGSQWQEVRHARTPLRRLLGAWRAALRGGPLPTLAGTGDRSNAARGRLRPRGRAAGVADLSPSSRWRVALACGVARAASRAAQVAARYLVEWADGCFKFRPQWSSEKAIAEIKVRAHALCGNALVLTTRSGCPHAWRAREQRRPAFGAVTPPVCSRVACVRWRVAGARGQPALAGGGDGARAAGAAGAEAERGAAGRPRGQGQVLPQVRVSAAAGTATRLGGARTQSAAGAAHACLLAACARTAGSS